MKPLARVLVVATVVVGLGMALAPPASAHTIAGAQPTNYRSTIDAISPAVPGLEVRLLDLGRRVEVVNHTDTDVVVLGYQGEPYLRVGPKGVFENRHSPTLYLNRITKVSPTPPVLPPAADANAPPSWHRIGGGRQVRWSDQRTRWEGPTPASVQNSPDRAQVVSNYTIQLLHGARVVAVSGVITWQPPPSAAPWLLVALSLFILTLGFATTERRGAALSAVLAVLLATDIVHTMATATPAHDALPTLLSKVLLGGIASTVVWIGGIIAIALLQRDDRRGVILAGTVGLAIALYSGVSDLSTLSHSEVQYAFPAVAARAAVSAALGLGAGLAVASIVIIVTSSDRRRLTGSEA